MTSNYDIAITGCGCISPLGNSRQELAQAVFAGQCGIEKLIELSDVGRTTLLGARIQNFNGREFVTPRKALKVMSREVQLAYAAAKLAWRESFPTDDLPEPDRLGVIYGSEMIPGDIGDLTPAVQACIEDGQLDSSRWGSRFSREIVPLWMLKNLPNMPACHVGIAIDARGPNNTIAQEEVSGILALVEGTTTITRDAADVMLVGGMGSRVSTTRLSYRPSELYAQHPADEIESSSEAAWIPAFDRRRRGIVASEGAVGLVLERMSHAIKRGAPILAAVRGVASRFGTPAKHHAGSRDAIASAALAAMDFAGIEVSDLSHVCAQGFGHELLDIEEAEAIQSVVGDVPVTAYSSYFGSAGAASGLLEMTASLEAIRAGRIQPTLGLQELDPRCPIQLLTQTRVTDKKHFLKLSFTPQGHAAAVVIECMNPNS